MRNGDIGGRKLARHFGDPAPEPKGSHACGCLFLGSRIKYGRRHEWDTPARGCPNDYMRALTISMYCRFLRTYSFSL